MSTLVALRALRDALAGDPEHAAGVRAIDLVLGAVKPALAVAAKHCAQCETETTLTEAIRQCSCNEKEALRACLLIDAALL